MSRLDFAPGTEAMEVTDIETGHFVFEPKPDKSVSYRDLDEAIKGAGYRIDKAWIEVAGKMADGDELRIEETGQTFRLSGEPPGEAGKQITVQGEWKWEDGTDLIVVGTEPKPSK